MYYVYVLKNKQGKHYTGSTNNIEERLQMHNDISKEKSLFHHTTYRKGPWEVIFSKEFLTREEAARFERFLKTGNGREWLERGRLGD